MRLLKVGLVGIVLTGSIFLGGKNYSATRLSEKNVAVGSAEYGEGILKSEGFIECTGIVVDSGKKAIMIHAMPSEYEKSFGNSFFEYTSRGGKPIMVKDISYAIKSIAELEKIDLKSSRTIVLVEENQDIEEVRGELNDVGLSMDRVIRYSKKNRKEKSMTYNTQDNKLKIR